MENLQRYDCDFDQCGIMDNGMIPNPKGSYVKFSDVEEALRSASDNTESLPFPDCRECKIRFNGCTTRCGTPTCKKIAVQHFDNEPETANIS
jgi:hypothetical protein